MEPAFTTKVGYVLTNDDEFETTVNIYKYSDKSIAMTCSEHFGKAFANRLKDIGSYNGKLKIGKGWVFANGKYPTLQTIFSEIIAKTIKGEIPVEYNTSRTPDIGGPLGPMPNEPSIVTDFKNIFLKLNSTKGKTIFVSGEHTYIWGSQSDVYANVLDMGKEIKWEFKTQDHLIVLC